ncbi:sarcosine oxidase subunit gamma [Jannaschia sp. 2305UL9-9]|uniref:sarcosine oxidase subunit gamma n=1 Tax=Jannaschia sp. 2305UL9-9 TaxID=3121638 RepID=UPI0035295FB9
MSETTISPVGPLGMITLRGDHAVLAPAIDQVLKAGMPAQRMMTRDDSSSILWMSPDELLVICDHGAAPGLADDLRGALGGAFATVAVVSDARVAFDIKGAGARDVIMRLSPVDFARLAPTEVRRTRLALIPAALWQIEDGIRVVCFRSVADYALDLLSDAAA